VVLRLKRSLGGAIGAVRRWLRRWEEAARRGVPGAAERARRLRIRLTQLDYLRRALERVGWDVFKLAVAEAWVAAIRGDRRLYVPDDFPPKLRDALREAYAMALRFTTWAGDRRTGWDAMVDCDGSIIDALRETRPADRACFYAYIEFEEEETYRDDQRRAKTTKVLTKRLWCGRLRDTTWSEVAEAAYMEARRLAEANRRAISDVCVVLKPAL